MSWSVNAIGKAPAVAAKLAVDFGKIKCPEPEETIKKTMAAVIATALAWFPLTQAVRVEAHGCQSHPNFSKAPHETTHQLAVKIEPIWGFVE